MNPASSEKCAILLLAKCDSLVAFYTAFDFIFQATLVKSWRDFQTQFGGSNYKANAVKGFFDNGGQQLYIVRVATIAPQSEADLAALLKAGIHNIPVRWRHP